MTWKELKTQIEGMDGEQLNQDVTIYDANIDEYFGCYNEKLNYCDDGVLDDNSPFLVFNGETKGD
jgi:hypothetical protein